MNVQRGWVELVLFFLIASSTACAHTPLAPPRMGAEGRPTSPLGSSYLLVPVPSEEASVLGRVLPEPPEPGVTLEEIARPNPCGSLLSQPVQSPSANTFEDAQELSQGVQGRAILGSFGFSAAAEYSTHFVYRLQTEKRIATLDTNEYVQCCRSNDCGYGYVSALIYGDAEYVAGEETSASAGVDFVYAGASGDMRIKALQKRKARGWMAALVTVTDRSQRAELSPVGGQPIAGISETTLPDQVRALYQGEKLRVEGTGEEYSVHDGHGTAITENEMVRRFRNVSGSSELDDFEYSRGTNSIVWGSVLTGAGAIALAGGVYVLVSRGCYSGPTGCEDPATGEDDTTGLVGGTLLASFGGTGMVFGFLMLIDGLSSSDGSVYEHDLSMYDAQLYVERHNRALLRKAVRDVQRHSAQDRASVQLNLGAGSLALHGQF